MAKRPYQTDPAKEEPGLRTQSTLAELEVEDESTFPIQQVATIGRAPDSNIVLNVRSVSRHHARIFYEGGHFWIKDLDSGNGTTVNGKRVKLQMLSDKDRIGFGEANAIFRSGSQSGPALLGHDPLENSEFPAPDGTPTGGLGGFFPNITTDRMRKKSERPPETPPPPPFIEPVAPPPVAEAPVPEIPVRNSRLEELERENDALRLEIAHLRSSDMTKENERLRRLVAQLERALADSNVRIRMLQDRLGG
jgi:pSer/pThr/pTyr-binding forkhead associated (FHA) protein